MVVRISWPLRKEPWFWAVMTGFTALHIIAMAKFDWSWTRTSSGHSLSGLLLSDTVAMVVVIYGLYRLLYGSPATALTEDPDDAPDYAERDLNL